MMSIVSDILIFVEISKTGSLTGAGKNLGLPKSTISRRLSQLEESLGIRLIQKSTRKLTLTEAGAAFLERSQRLSADVEELLSFASDLSGNPKGTLRISMPPNLGDMLLSDIIADFSRQYPEIILEIDESQRFVDLVAERYDLAIRGGKMEDSSYISKLLAEFKLGVFVSPNFYKKINKIKNPKELDKVNFIVLKGRSAQDKFNFTYKNNSVNMQFNSQVVVTTAALQLNLALRGVGAVVMGERFCREAVGNRRLVRVLPEWELPTTSLWVVTPSRHLLPRKTSLFIDFLFSRINKA